VGSHLQEQRRAASERPKAIRPIPRARSGPWRSGTGRRLTRARATRRRAARERDRAHWLASPNWQPVHAAAWWWWWSFVRRPPSSPTRLCVPTNGTLRSPRARRRSGLTRVAWRTETAVFWFLVWVWSGRSWLVFQRLALQNLGEYKIILIG